MALPVSWKENTSAVRIHVPLFVGEGFGISVLKQNTRSWMPAFQMGWTEAIVFEQEVGNGVFLMSAAALNMRSDEQFISLFMSIHGSQPLAFLHDAPDGILVRAVG